MPLDFLAAGGLHPTRALLPAGPRHITIVALGFTAEDYMKRAKQFGDRHRFADQIWGINQAGNILRCDLVWHMDDVRIQEIRARANPDGTIANMLQWLKTYDGTVMTSRAHPDYPCLVEFPLEDVLNRYGWGYFNSTTAYAAAYAGYLGAQQISLFGCDFTYADSHKAEKGRACLEWWLGFLAGGGGAAPGISINVPAQSSLMDAIEDQSEDDAVFYGYDAVEVSVTRDEAGKFKIAFTERAELPTAEEIEDAYDHGRPPVKQGIRR